MTGRRASAALLLALAALFAGSALADPHALWRIVHGACAPNQRERGDPAPCAVLDPARGIAVLKDRRGREQYLLIPTVRIAGIESPPLRRPGGPNYFAEAWSRMQLVEAKLGRSLPRDDLSLAVNSAYGRTQDQLHIHMDCIQAEVRRALQADQGRITAGAWYELPGPLGGGLLRHHYRVIRIDVPALGPTDPFQLLAASLADPDGEMARHTLVLVGTSLPKPGFMLLDGRSGLRTLNPGSGEALQDHGCALAAEAARGSTSAPPRAMPGWGSARP